MESGIQIRTGAGERHKRGCAGDAGGVSVLGLQARVFLFSPEAANDRLTVNGLGGNDTINASSLEADGIQLTMNGGLGEDNLLGSEGEERFHTSLGSFMRQTRASKYTSDAASIVRMEPEPAVALWRNWLPECPHHYGAIQ